MMWNLLVSGAGRRFGAGPLRRRPGQPRPLDPVAAGGGDGDDRLRGQRPLPCSPVARQVWNRPGPPTLSPGQGRGINRRPHCRRKGFRWVYEAVSRDALLNSVSGGTDVCSAFVGACPMLAVREGPHLPAGPSGPRSRPSTPDGRSVVGEQGELVITEPMPSMPVGFWGRTGDGSRYRSAYFDDFPRRVAPRRLDRLRRRRQLRDLPAGRTPPSNRGGVRLGTSEFYSVVDGFPRGGRQPRRATSRTRPGEWHRDGRTAPVRRAPPPASTSTTGSRPASPASLRRSLSPPPRPPTPSTVSQAYPGRCRGRSWKYP